MVEQLKEHLQNYVNNDVAPVNGYVKEKLNSRELNGQDKPAWDGQKC